MPKKITYKDSGVDIDEGEKLVSLIKPMAKATNVKGVLSGIGGFGASFSAKFSGMKDPVLVSSTDGVGTKLKVAFLCDKHDTVGIDLVAMSVNDIVTTGARPLFFLDYFATGKLSAKTAAKVIKGIAFGCKESGCALIGGETAEMPGLYSEGEYDLAGFAVGVIDRKNIISGSRIKPGDAIIGLPSSGLHSNGYSLARKIVFDKMRLKPSSKVKGFKKPIGEELLTPTRIYVKPVLELAKKVDVLGLAHITGGGFTENIPRILPKNTVAAIQRGSWTVPPIFRLLMENGPVAEAEMLRTFNSGIGMVAVVRSKDVNAALACLKKSRISARVIGTIEKRAGRAPQVKFI
ncbi:MAG: phosphoribosylformylglycinamidine cyclo-ligase [Deltaproteobacteria bacterium]|nr:phosphoribosylformylglycinamidine cyclo-ligase [Deltaproteobacteria bacterium]